MRGDGALSALTGDGALCWTRGAGAGAALRGVLRTAGAGGGADGALYAERCFWTGALVAAGAFGAVAYRISATGPDHEKLFTAEVFVDDVSRGVGTGRTKKVAEQQAAQVAWTAITEGESADA